MHVTITLAQPPEPGTTVIDGTTVLAATATIGLTVLVAGACVVVWLAVRGSRPEDRPTVLRALAQVLDAIAGLTRRR